MFDDALVEKLPIYDTKYYDDYVNFYLKLKWDTALSLKKTVVEFRDCAEDLWESFSGETLYADELVKLLKTSDKPRIEITLDFLVAKARSKIYGGLSYKKYHVECEIKAYLALVKSINHFRPPMKCSIQELEDVLKKFDIWKSLDESKVQECMTSLKLNSPWPVLALWNSYEDGSVDDIFLNVPMPRVFGAPSCVRNNLERKIDVTSLVKASRELLTLENTVVCGHGTICYKTPSGWVSKEDDTAHLVAPIPGLNGHVFMLSPSMHGSICKLSPWSKVLEFDLPKDEECVNWIDCQRDLESNLVLSWGHINPLTGALQNHNMTTMTEQGIFGSAEILANSTDVIDRRTKGIKIDWRDHGNLLSVHHKVIENYKTYRDWSHQYDIVFANNVLMTLESNSRPIEAVFGEPNNIFLLSPLSSSQTVQHWVLKDGYKMINSSSIPKSAKAWTSICMVRY